MSWTSESPVKVNFVEHLASLRLPVPSRDGRLGDLDEHDHRQNEAALSTRERVFSSYDTQVGKVRVITEADRSVTTVLLPEDY